MAGKKAVVLDAAVFINADFLHASKEKGEFYTTPSVLMELKDNLSRLKAEVVMRQNHVVLHDPGTGHFNAALEAARKTGDVSRLSSTDLQVLALCIELKEKGETVELLTDDYRLQNTAHSLRIKWKPVAMRGIKEQRRLVSKCTMCGFEAQNHLTECPKCSGSMLTRERRPEKRQSIKKHSAKTRTL